MNTTDELIALRAELVLLTDGRVARHHLTHGLYGTRAAVLEYLRGTYHTDLDGVSMGRAWVTDEAHVRHLLRVRGGDEDTPEVMARLREWGYAK